MPVSTGSSTRVMPGGGSASGGSKKAESRDAQMDKKQAGPKARPTSSEGGRSYGQQNFSGAKASDGSPAPNAKTRPTSGENRAYSQAPKVFGQKRS